MQAAGNLDETSLAAQSVIMTCDQIMNVRPKEGRFRLD